MYKSLPNILTLSTLACLAALALAGLDRPELLQPLGQPLGQSPKPETAPRTGKLENERISANIDVIDDFSGNSIYRMAREDIRRETLARIHATVMMHVTSTKPGSENSNTATTDDRRLADVPIPSPADAFPADSFPGDVFGETARP